MTTWEVAAHLVDLAVADLVASEEAVARVASEEGEALARLVDLAVADLVDSEEAAARVASEEGEALAMAAVA